MFFRYQDAQREIQRLTARVQFLEDLLVRQAQGVLDSALHKQGMFTPTEAAAVREQVSTAPADSEPKQFGHNFKPLDWTLYENHKNDLAQAFPTMTAQQMQRHYLDEYGEDALPSTYLL